MISPLCASLLSALKRGHLRTILVSRVAAPRLALRIISAAFIRRNAVFPPSSEADLTLVNDTVVDLACRHTRKKQKRQN